MPNCTQCNLKITNWLTQKWYSKNLFSFLLLPFSWIFCGVVFIRRFLYRHHILKSQNFSVPIIVVGNISVGGTGKTPLVIWLVNLLKQHGYKPGIVSRGYGGKTKYPAHVGHVAWIKRSDDPGNNNLDLAVKPRDDNFTATQVGDEAILIAQKTQCPVVVDPNRVNAVKELLAKYNCDVVISDDGLQHYAMQRDIEIAVIDGQRKLGNEFCLPAGPLRETKRRLNEVDFVIVVNGEANENEFSAQTLTQSIYNLIDPELILDAEQLQQPVHAVAGIGNPEKFFNSLRQLGIMFIPHIFPDHYLYKQDDFHFNEDAIIIMTEKDAVKCTEFADHRFWCLPIEIMAPELGKAILKKVEK